MKKTVSLWMRQAVILWFCLATMRTSVVWVASFSSSSSTTRFHQRSNQNVSPYLSISSTSRVIKSKSLSPLVTYSSSSPSTSNPNQIRQMLLTLVTIFRKFFYPHTMPDTKVQEPLPTGTLGCPFFGHFFMKGDAQNGPGTFWRKMSRKLNDPGIFKFAFVGKPMAVVYGSENIKNVLDREFKDEEQGGIRTGTMTANSKAATEIFGTQSLLMAQNKADHSYLRKLVGQSMTPSALAGSIPQLVTGVEMAIQDIKMQGTSKKGIVMEDVCTKYTLDVAWRQILGLDLKNEEEIDEFTQNVKDWIYGILNPLLFVAPTFVVKRLKSYKAKQYLNNMIIQKIEQVEARGVSDGSTLSEMVFATDKDDSNNSNGDTQIKKLSRRQIIDNALLLILAGSETSASTLTTAMLFLGMYPEIYQKIMQEQKDIQAKHGSSNEESLTRKILDEEMPYLEAVIKETMRIKPLNQGAGRITKSTIVVDGQQIPKGWPVLFNVQLTHARDPVIIKTDGKENVMNIYEGFKPERWLNEDTKPDAWMSFGYGPRYCLGANLAMAEMKIFLAVFVRNIDTFKLVNGEKDVKWQKLAIIPKPRDGTLIQV